jgi:hypothetical protein
VPTDDDPFADLVGLWVEHISLGSTSGQIVLLTDEQLQEEEPSYEYRVRFDDVMFSRWDRKGTRPVAAAGDTSVHGRLERVERSGDTWMLSGGFGELAVTAADVRRSDEDLHHPARPAPDLDVEPPHACEAMVFALAHDDDGMEYIPQFREYGYAYVVGDSSIHVIDFCPFCGAALPPGLREEWFNRVRALGLEPFDDEVPEPLRTDRWWHDADFVADPPARDVGSARRLPP